MSDLLDTLRLLPPGTLMILGAFLLTLVRGLARQIGFVVLPILSLFHMLMFPLGFYEESVLNLFSYELHPIRVDEVTYVWGFVFHLAAICGTIYSLHLKYALEPVSALAYAGASIAAVFAGDLLTLFVFWEITAVASLVLIWIGPGSRAFAAGFRYALLHIGSGVLVLAGAVATAATDRSAESLAFGAPGEFGMFHELQSVASWLLLAGFGIKAAFPLLHTWLADAYPEASPSGTVFLSAFTTKMAIYALLRGFAGCEPLVIIGTIMAIYPLAHAILADDMRRSLAHILNNQLGFMVVAIGIGTPLAINGATAQAFAHVLYKGLLFMSTGAVLHQIGSCHQSTTGGLYRKMPWTFAFCLVGALSVMPLNCGFVTKGVVMAAVGEHHLDWTWMLLMLGAIGAFLVAGIKVPYFLFLAPPSNSAPTGGSEAPLHMRVAMGIAATLCLLVGIFPGLLYERLPFEMEYASYTYYHVVNQLQLLAFIGLTFVAAIFWDLYPRPVVGSLRDTDWFVRKPIGLAVDWWQRRQPPAEGRQIPWINEAWNSMSRLCNEGGIMGRSVSTSVMAFAAVVILGFYLISYYR